MRIAIVNDLALAREVLRRLVDSVPGYSVAWTAADGAEAVRRAAADRPDVILMDLVMPVLDGAEATRQIMAATPCPVLIVTASVGANLGKVYEALGAGGLDAVKTPALGPDGRVRGGEAILARLARLEHAARRSARAEVSSRSTLHAPRSTPSPGVPFLAIGASTGGPEAVARILAALVPTPPGPVVIVQHLAADFAAGFATWLQGRTGLSVRLASDGVAVESGQVYVAAGDHHLTLRPDCRFGSTADPKDYPYRPSVDVFFESLVAAWPRPGVAVLLTGMGGDGARGLMELKARGWHTIAQDRATSVVYGMPKAAAERGAACAVLPLPEIGPAVRDRLTVPSDSRPGRAPGGPPC